MGKNDYVPARNSEFQNFSNNFAKQIATHQAEVVKFSSDLFWGGTTFLFLLKYSRLFLVINSKN